MKSLPVARLRLAGGISEMGMPFAEAARGKRSGSPDACAYLPGFSSSRFSVRARPYQKKGPPPLRVAGLCRGGQDQNLVRMPNDTSRPSVEPLA